MCFEWKKFTKLCEACGHLFNNKFLSDIQFKFACGRIIYAHSLFLTIRGQGFYNFFRDYIGVKKLIPVEDFTYEIFYEFLKSIYESEEFVVTEANCLESLRLGCKYGVYDVEERSKSFIRSNIKLSNVCDILEAGIKTDCGLIQSDACNFLDENAKEVLAHESFCKINLHTLTTILEWPNIRNLETTEFDIFTAVMRWAAGFCDRAGHIPDGPTKRLLLGDILKLIRFPAMTTAQFSECIQMEPHLLEDNEISSIFMNITTKQQNAFGFLDYKRLNLNTSAKIKINERTLPKIKYLATQTSSTKFKLTKSILLTAFGHYASKDVQKMGIRICTNENEIYNESVNILYMGSCVNIMLAPVRLEMGGTYEIYLDVTEMEAEFMVGYPMKRKLPLSVMGNEYVDFHFSAISPYIERLYYNVL